MKGLEFRGILLGGVVNETVVSKKDGRVYEKVGLMVQNEDGDNVYVTAFGKRSEDINDMGLVAGDKLELVFDIVSKSVDTKDGKKVFVSLEIVRVGYLGGSSNKAEVSVEQALGIDVNLIDDFAKSDNTGLDFNEIDENEIPF